MVFFYSMNLFYFPTPAMIAISTGASPGRTATLGYDAIVGVAIVLLGVGIGFSTGILAPTTAVAQDLAELPAYSGMWLRVVSFVLFYVVTAAYIIWYGERCK